MPPLKRCGPSNRLGATREVRQIARNGVKGTTLTLATALVSLTTQGSGGSRRIMTSQVKPRNLPFP